MSVSTQPRLSWSETRRRLRADHERLVQQLNEAHGGPRRSARLHPGYVCVFLYRVGNHLHRGGHLRLARIAWQLNLLLTGADVNPYCDLGEGLVVTSPPGVAVMGRAGRNLTVMACAGMGGEVGNWKDIGGGPGLACLGDDVTLEPHTAILGPVRVGNRVRVGAGVILTEDVPDDCAVELPRPRVLRRGAAG